MSDKDKTKESKEDRAERFVWQPTDLIVHSGAEGKKDKTKQSDRAKKAFGKK